MSTIKALIVDDEPLARERVRSLLAEEADIEILAECASGTEAVAAAKRTPPDLIFLDVQMPEMDGFQVLRELPPPLPVVIFITAFNEHAVKAFEAEALDYILKPFKVARFRAALDRARERISRQQPDDSTRRLLALLEAQNAAAKSEYLTRIAVRDGSRVKFVKTSAIDWIEASGNYVVLHAGKENHIVRETLAAFEAQLSPKDFVRLSRSAIVNLDRVQQVEPAFNDEHVVVLTTGAKLPMTRGLRELQEKLKFG
jgi:two-component system, LytTR family, response regulator